MDNYLYIDTDDCIRLSGLKDVVTDAYVNDATVTATVYDSDGIAVSGAEDLSIPYIADSNGNYAGQVPNTVTITKDAEYEVEVTAVKGDFKTTYRFNATGAYKRP